MKGLKKLARRLPSNLVSRNCYQMVLHFEKGKPIEITVDGDINAFYFRAEDLGMPIEMWMTLNERPMIGKRPHVRAKEVAEIYPDTKDGLELFAHQHGLSL